MNCHIWLPINKNSIKITGQPPQSYCHNQVGGDELPHNIMALLLYSKYNCLHINIIKDFLQ